MVDANIIVKLLWSGDMAEECEWLIWVFSKNHSSININIKELK